MTTPTANHQHAAVVAAIVAATRVGGDNGSGSLLLRCLLLLGLLNDLPSALCLGGKK